MLLSFEYYIDIEIQIKRAKCLILTSYILTYLLTYILTDYPSHRVSYKLTKNAIYLTGAKMAVL